jgi:hypothetical protein
LPQNPEGRSSRRLLLVKEGHYGLAISALERAHRIYFEQKNPAVLDADALRVLAYRQIHNVSQLAIATSDIKDSCGRYPDRSASTDECVAFSTARPAN